MVKGRFFLIGCPRSGTTLLQCMLAVHPQIMSFPESHFFGHLIETARWRRMLGLAQKDIGTRLRDYLEKLGRPELEADIPVGERKVRPYAQVFIRMLDRLAADQGKTLWLEKTPVHLLYIPYITRLVPDARFIHLLRDGEDVVASLCEVTQKHPDIWGGVRTPEECVQRWIRDIEISRRYDGHADHHLVRYEQLVAEPEPVLEGLCRFMAIPFDPRMLSEHTSAAQSLVLGNETWKRGAGEAIYATGSVKFNRIFNDEQKQTVRRGLAGFELDRLFPRLRLGAGQNSG